MKTYLDSGVLITAWRGAGGAQEAAMRLLDDGGRHFLTSALARLELLPKPAFEKRHDEGLFYTTHFKRCRAVEPLSAQLGRDAEDLAKEHGLAAVDALHMAAALRMGAAEFYTSEKPSKPLFRVPGIRVISIIQP